jgi:hypothetical protein
LGTVARLAFAATICALLTGCDTSAPDVVPLDEGFSSLEYAEGMVACLGPIGWDVHVDPDEQSVEAEFPESDGDRFVEDYRRCEKALGADRPPELSDEEWRALYDAYIDTLDCLQDFGIAMPDGASWEVFRAAPLGSYYAYKEFPTESYADFQRAETACPQP